MASSPFRSAGGAMRTIVKLGLLLLVAGAPVACLNADVTGTRPLTFTMSASDTTTLVDTEVSFVFAATGTALQLVWFDFGDGGADTLLLGGAVVEASGSVMHTFDAVGSYVVSGSTRGVDGTESQQVTIEVN